MADRKYMCVLVTGVVVALVTAVSTWLITKTVIENQQKKKIEEVVVENPQVAAALISKGAWIDDKTKALCPLVFLVGFAIVVVLLGLAWGISKYLSAGGLAAMRSLPRSFLRPAEQLQRAVNL